MTVLVLTEDLDPTADRVIDQLNRRGVPVLRADTGWFPYRLTLTGELVDGRWVGALITPQHSVQLQQLRSVWYRRPTAFTFPHSWPVPLRRHAAYEAKFGLGGVLWPLPVLWVNHPAHQADLYKPTQLSTATACGLPVPDTLVTNDPQQARQFITTHPGGVVVKPLGFSSITGDDHRQMIYTHLITEDDLSHLDTVASTAHLLQAWVDKSHEVRLTVVGQRMFAAAIHTEHPQARVDFRADYHSLRYTVVDVPEQIRRGVAAFMTHFGLAFGAFDFCVDPDGCWWMLECNGGGQYGFIEQSTGLPISDAIADLLAKGLS